MAFWNEHATARVVADALVSALKDYYAETPITRDELVERLALAERAETMAYTDPEALEASKTAVSGWLKTHGI